MLKRIILFGLTNVLILTMLVIVLNLFGIRPYLSEQGIQYVPLLIFSVVLGFGGAFISLALSKWMAKTFMKVQVINPRQPANEAEKWLVDRVHQLSRKAGLTTMPEVGVYPSDEVNAFATGPSKRNSLVAVSAGLLQQLDGDEVEAVLAHEVAHIANGDMVTMTLIQGVVNTFVIFLARIIASVVASFIRSEASTLVYFACVIFFQIVFSILGTMVVMAFSRHREFRADAAASQYAGADKMVRALQRLQQNSGRVDTSQQAYQSLKISGGNAGFLRLFMSHPPIEERIAALKAS